MKIQSVFACYFSPTGNSRRLACAAAEELADALGCPWQEQPFTRPEERGRSHTWGSQDFVVFAVPTYAGKLPNKILPDLKRQLAGSRTPAMALVTYGNRSFDHSLAELCAVLEHADFQVLSAGAFVCRHAFTDRLAGDRPNGDDLAQLTQLCRQTAEKLACISAPAAPLEVPGDAAAPYYVPKGRDGQPVDFLRARPKTRADACIRCGECAAQCPMGAISRRDVAQVPGICIKCQRCVRICPVCAKYFDDPAFLSHVAMLEETYMAPKGSATFL